MQPHASASDEHERAIALYRQLLAASSDILRSTRVARPLPSDRRTAKGGDRILSTGGGHPTELRRCLLEPRQSQDLSLFAGRDRAHARRGSGSVPQPLLIATICASHWAKRTRTGASTRNRGNSTSAATHSSAPKAATSGDRRNKHAQADRGVHGAVFRRARGRRGA